MNYCKIIALMSQKGGAGKTTVTMQLAAGLHSMGYAVAVADLDAQQSAQRWAQSALAAGRSNPFPAEVYMLNGGADNLRVQLKTLMKNRDMVLCDCPPALEHPHTQFMLSVADLIVVPVIPSPPDIWSARAVEEVIVRQQQVRKGLQAVLLANRVQRTALAASAIEILREFRLPLLSAGLSQRNAYAQSALQGSSVMAMGKVAELAQQEVVAVVRAIMGRLDKIC